MTDLSSSGPDSQPVRLVKVDPPAPSVHDYIDEGGFVSFNFTGDHSFHNLLRLRYLRFELYEDSMHRGNLVLHSWVTENCQLLGGLTIRGIWRCLKRNESKFRRFVENGERFISIPFDCRKPEVITPFFADGRRTPLPVVQLYDHMKFIARSRRPILRIVSPQPSY